MVLVTLEDSYVSSAYLGLSLYSQHLGSDLLRTDSLGGDSLLRQLWDHQDAILCCSLKVCDSKRVWFYRLLGFIYFVFWFGFIF